MNDVQSNETPSKDYTQELNDGHWEDAILARWEDAEKSQPSKDEPEATSEIDDEDNQETIDDEVNEETETTEDTDDSEEDAEENDEPDTDDDDLEEDESDDEDEDSDAVELSDDATIEIMVEGKAHQPSIRDLKRLYGQEASLTRKSQETAERRKEADTAISKSQAVFNKMLSQAQERFKPYENIDMLLAAKEMSTEDFTALRKEAQAAYEDVQFLTSEADSYFGELQAQQAQALKTAASECVKVLQESVPDWSNTLYNDIRHYAIAQGLPEPEVNQYVDPIVIQLLNKARLYDQGKKVATVKKQKQTATKKVLRSKKSPANEASRKKSAEASELQKLRASNGNDMDDIANVFLKRWEA